MSAVPRKRNAGRFPGLDEAKLLAILDAIPARIAFIGRDLRHLYVNSEQAQSQGVKQKRSSARPSRRCSAKNIMRS